MEVWRWANGEVPEQRHRRGRATSRSPVGFGAGRGRAPGVVGAQRPDQGGVDRFASEGFVALAPDIYRGAVTDEPDEAGKLMMALNIEQAAKDMAGAVDFLVAHDAVTSQGVGVIGYCMGGGLALWLATLRPDAVGAVVPYYGDHPVARSAARLSRCCRRRCRATTRRTTTSPAPGGGCARGAADERWARRTSSSCTPAPSTRSPTTTGPRSSTRSTPRPPGPAPSSSSAHVQ